MSIFFTLVTQLGTILEQHSTVTTCLESRDEKDLDEPLVTSTMDINETDGQDLDQHHTDNQAQTEKIQPPETKDDKQKTEKNRRHYGNCRGPRFRSSSIPSLRSLDSDHDLGGGVSQEHDDDSDYLWSESEDSGSGESDNEENDDELKHRRRKLSHDMRDAFNGISNGDVLNKAFSSSSSNCRSEPSTGGSGENSQKSIDCLKQELLEAFHTGKTSPADQLNGRSSSLGEEKERCGIDVEGLLKCQSQIGPLLIALTPFIRWLQTSPAVKDALAANAEKVFLEKLCGMLTILTSSNWAQVLDDAEVGNEKVKTELSNDWEALLASPATSEDPQNETSQENLFKFQLSEDRSMLGMPALKNFVQGLKVSDELTEHDQVIR